MNQIATVTLNPAIDLTVRADHFQPGTVNQGQSMQFDAGGKGVNVAAFLADYGLHCAVTGFLGQDNTELFTQLFVQQGIVDHFIRIPGRTRTGVKIVDEARQETTDINMPGLTPDAEQIGYLLQRIDELAHSYTWFVLAGKVPPGMPTEIYATIIQRLKAQGRSVALDTSGAALQAGAQAAPTIMKPNIDELEQLFNERFSTEDELAGAAQRLLTNGTQIVVISMGKQGAFFIDQQQTLIAQPPTVNVKSTVGAGDAMVAGLLAGLTQGLELSECARLATAFSVGTITRVGPHLPTREALAKIKDQVSIRTLSRATAPIEPEQLIP
jgi:1-phosphofructokinase